MIQTSWLPVQQTHHSHFKARVISHETPSFSSEYPSPGPTPCLLQFTNATMNVSFSSEEGYITCSSLWPEKKRFSLLILWRCSFGAFWTIFSGYCSGSSSVQISVTVLSLVIGVSCREKDQRSSVDYWSISVDQWFSLLLLTGCCFVDQCSSDWFLLTGCCFVPDWTASCWSLFWPVSFLTDIDLSVLIFL